MKKSVLVLLAAGAWVCADAQSQTKTKALPIERIPMAKVYNPDENAGKANNNTKVATHRNLHRVNNVAGFNKVEVSGSYNPNSALTAENTQLTYNNDLKMVAFTHRGSAYYLFGSGTYETDFSTDLGNSWDSSTLVNENFATRYPNGSILNPAGNLTPNKAYSISTGPHVSGSTWDSVYMSSVRLNSTNTNIQRKIMYPNAATSPFTPFCPPHFETICDDSTIHSVQEAWTYNAALTATYGFYGAIINTGTWSSVTNSVTWSSKVIRPHLVSGADTSLHTDTLAELSYVAMAWSQDGKIGYVVFFGNLDSANYAYDYESEQPIVYKSTDHGGTWNMMPMFNFGTIPNLVQYIRPTADNLALKLPMWDINGDSSGYYPGHDVDATVDTNGNLHIFGAISASPCANPDSGGYQYYPTPSGGRYIYDVYTTTATGGWKATFIDSLHSPMGCPGALGGVWANASPAIGWGARIQASRTKGGSKVFCTYLDDYQGDYAMVSPDITTAEIDVATNNVTGPTQITNDADNYLLMVSDIAAPDSPCWDIPCAVMADNYPASNGTNPVHYYYVQGVCAQPAGINEVKSNTGFSVSQNFPNPFTKLTSFNVNLDESSTVSVDVYNMVGQKIWSMSPERMEPGTHTVTLNGAFSAGVYFYRVMANGFAVTHKMVVE
jgi:hypothetical protein